MKHKALIALSVVIGFWMAPQTKAGFPYHDGSTQHHIRSSHPGGFVLGNTMHDGAVGAKKE